ncbi:acyl-CoA thioesterase [Novosphingobium sp. KCTC 2891]|uniref:acyl-CoA thioesterase n=1 Tax=Novosphingobium sp. KCTC 2891 TaxID=2989730 RepID=UPI002221E654|nr:thioesterase family protein [Novosphingobium sp. KCTC 2891]MCW1382204.1 acyl-CoA thioesterase [Novosphingobium sp. KCTC 2891]
MAKPDPALLDPARYPFAHEVTTRFADLDPNDHINNVAMAAVLEDGRVRFNMALGLRRAENFRPMVASVSIDYLAQAHFPQPMTCHVAACDIGRSSWQMQQVLVQEGRAVATCRTVVVCTDGQKAIPLPEDFRDRLGPWLLK